MDSGNQFRRGGRRWSRVAAALAPLALGGCLVLRWNYQEECSAETAPKVCDDREPSNKDECDLTTATCKHTALSSPWSRRYGGAEGSGSSNEQTCKGVAIDAMGNFVIGGVFTGTLDFGGGPMTTASSEKDIYLARFDASGNHLWSKRFGGQAPGTYVLLQTIAADGAGDTVISGYFSGTLDFGGGALVGQGDFFVESFDSSGNHRWGKVFDGPTNAQSSAMDSAGNVAIIGTFHSKSLDFGGGVLPTWSDGSDERIFVVRLDAMGNHLWSKALGALDNDNFPWAGGVALDGSGAVILSGMVSGHFDFGAGPMDVSGNAFVAKYDEMGKHAWSKVFTGVRFLGTDLPNGGNLAVDPQGAIVMTGFTASGSQPIDLGGGPLPPLDLPDGKFYEPDAILVKFDASGKHLWSRRFGDAENYQHGGRVAIDGAGAVVLMGDYDGVLDLGGGVLPSGCTHFLARFDASGDHLWSRCFRATVSLTGYNITAATSGEIIMTGNFLGSIDVGAGPLEAEPSNGDIFLAAFPP